MKKINFLQSATDLTGVRTIFPEQICPSVRVRVWAKFKGRVRVGGQFLVGGYFLRTDLIVIISLYLNETS